MRRFGEFIHNIYAPKWLGILVAILLILKLPSFFEPYYYGDEMIYLALGQGIRQGIPLYSGLHDNKPPLIYLLAAIAGNLFWFKVILAIFNIASIILLWKLVRAIFPGKEKLHMVTVSLFGVLTTIPLLEGNTVNAELLMIVPSLAAFFVLWAKKNNPKNLFFAGTLFGLATLFKIPAVFELPVIFVFWLITSGFNLKKGFYIVSGFLVPIVLSFLWFALRGAGGEYFTAAFLQNLGYISTWKEGSGAWGNFFAGKESLFIRFFVVLTGSTVLFSFRKKLSKPFIFLSVWLLFSLFAITLSERPYPHYLIQALPAFSILVGMLIAQKNMEQSLVTIPLALFFLVPTFYNFWSYQTVEYYGRFLNFATRKYSEAMYFSEFEKQTSANYNLAEFLSSSSSPKERVFVWGAHSPTVYALARRLPPVKYVADYHVFDYSSQETIASEIAQQMPEFIVFQPGSKPFPKLREIAQENYLLIDNTEGNEVWIKSK